MTQTEFTSVAREIEAILTSPQPANSDNAIPKLLSIGAAMTQDEGDRFIDSNPELLKLSSRACERYCDYILEAEGDQAQQLLDDPDVEDFKFTRTANLFGQQAYNRVKDIFDRIDFTNCKRFVMVGCGTLPVTMFQVFEHTDVEEIVGLDVRPEAIEVLNAIVEKYNMKRIKPLLLDGNTYDFSGADVVYIANMVSPKEQVLKMVRETADDHVQIIMRDPYSIGRLWTEKGEDSLDENFKILGYGTPAPAYFSRDVFLEIASNP